MPNDKETNSQAANVEAISSGIPRSCTPRWEWAPLSPGPSPKPRQPGKPVPAGATGEGPFADIIHYGVQATSNVVSMVIRGMPIDGSQSPGTRRSAESRARVISDGACRFHAENSSVDRKSNRRGNAGDDI